MRKYYNWKMEGKPYPKTFTEDRINRLNELGFEWRLKDANSVLDHEDETQGEALMDVARRQPRDTIINMTVPRSVPERQRPMEGVCRLEPYRTNLPIYEQRGWM
jgi:hypothetical protein